MLPRPISFCFFTHHQEQSTRHKHQRHFSLMDSPFVFFCPNGLLLFSLESQKTPVVWRSWRTFGMKRRFKSRQWHISTKRAQFLLMPRVRIFTVNVSMQCNTLHCFPLIDRKYVLQLWHLVSLFDPIYDTVYQWRFSHTTEHDSMLNMCTFETICHHIVEMVSHTWCCVRSTFPPLQTQKFTPVS